MVKPTPQSWQGQVNCHGQVQTAVLMFCFLLLDRSVLSALEQRLSEQHDKDFLKVASLLFNTFIFAQIFNLVNSRRINDEYNVFEGLHTSTLFLIILGIIVVCQVGQTWPNSNHWHQQLCCNLCRCLCCCCFGNYFWCSCLHHAQFLFTESMWLLLAGCVSNMLRPEGDEEAAGELSCWCHP
jgi:hypothetical protein